jgi:hypothetical protein
VGGGSMVQAFGRCMMCHVPVPSCRPCWVLTLSTEPCCSNAAGAASGSIHLLSLYLVSMLAVACLVKAVGCRRTPCNFDQMITVIACGSECLERGY